ncbi:MAG TPA: hypothetical protein VF754_00640, partial [Pyrinomonadaceae bacterium]
MIKPSGRMRGVRFEKYLALRSVVGTRSYVAVMNEAPDIGGTGRGDEPVAEIAARVGVRAERGRRFAELTSLRVGGSIDWVVFPETEEQAARLVCEFESAGI